MPVPPGLERLFTAVDDPTPDIVKKGSIIVFNYVGQRPGQPINDPYPLIIVSDPQGTHRHPDLVRGVNLHYLILPYVKDLVMNYVSPTFSYDQIRGRAYAAAFRSYKRTGISNIKILDINFLKNLLAVVRALDVGEIEQIRQQIRQQLQMAEVNQPVAGPGEEIR